MGVLTTICRRSALCTLGQHKDPDHVRSLINEFTMAAGLRKWTARTPQDRPAFVGSIVLLTGVIRRDRLLCWSHNAEAEI